MLTFIANYTDSALVTYLALLERMPYDNRLMIGQCRAEINFRAKRSRMVTAEERYS